MADNPDEIFDIVDDNDTVIGTERRGIVHQKGLLHRAVHILVFNRGGNCFLQRRSMNKDSNPGRWDSSASGHCDSGEAYESSAYREVGEELGVVVEKLKEIGRIRACKETGNEFVRIYYTQHEGPFILHPLEISEGDWFSKERIDAWIQSSPEDFAQCFILVWKTVRGSI